MLCDYIDNIIRAAQALLTVRRPIEDKSEDQSADSRTHHMATQITACIYCSDSSRLKILGGFLLGERFGLEEVNIILLFFFFTIQLTVMATGFYYSLIIMLQYKINSKMSGAQDQNK